MSNLCRSTRLISFATPEFSQAAALLKKSARRFGIDCEIFTPQSVSIKQLAARNPEIMQSRRGAGYWLWKPWLLLETLRDSPAGSLVLYTDAALTFVSDPTPMLALAQAHPIVLFEQYHEALQRVATKRDCFVALDADDPAHWNTPQLVGGVQLYCACQAALDFVSEMLAASADRRTLTDDENVMGKPNLPEFRYHRHDQSVLTIVARRRGLPVFPDPTQYGPENGACNWPPRDDGIERPEVSYRHPLYVHRQRNTFRPVWMIRRLAGYYSAGQPI